MERADGYPGLAKTYGLNFANPPKQMELGLIYKALADKKIDFTAGNSTEGLVPLLKLTILADDKKYFPPYQAVPIFNQATLTKYPELLTVIDRLTGLISTQEMQKMNYQVDNQSDSAEQIVRNFLKSKSQRPIKSF
jgi:osmoprotectant transport system permease protein